MDTNGVHWPHLADVIGSEVIQTPTLWCPCVGAVAWRLERGTLNQDNPGSNPLAAVSKKGNFVHSTLRQFTQLYK